MLKVEKLNVYYGESHILRNVDLEVTAGKVVCLMGRNGVGKTTFLKTLTGLLPARSGRIFFRERDITKDPSYRRARSGIGYAPQGREIFAHLTVQENLLVGLDAARNGSKGIPEEVFDLFPVLKPRLKRRGGDLPGGQQQQLAIGRPLVSKPALLLLDEPTEGIQPSIILEIESAIRRLREKSSVGILLVEQYLDFAQRLADEFCTLAKGEVVTRGPIKELTPEVVRRHLTV